MMYFASTMQHQQSASPVSTRRGTGGQPVWAATTPRLWVRTEKEPE